jgi:hypothetical protein
VVVQYDDLDGDEQWDEIAFLCSLSANGKNYYTAMVTDQPATIKAVVRVHARHRRKKADSTFGPDLTIDSIPAAQPATDFTKDPLPPFLTEGPAWENDKVGFRIYFDVRNGKDIWGKTTPAMVLDAVGEKAADNYHAQADWGMDILKVGNSLGAGSLAMSYRLANGTDTLVRLGGESMGPVTYEKIADGPVRAVFRLTYNHWKVAAGFSPVQLTETISIWGGQYMFESRVTIKEAPANASLVTGIVNLHNLPAQVIDSGDIKVLYTYGLQSENHDQLGMALMVSGKNFQGFDSVAVNPSTTIQNTFFVKQAIPAQGALTYRFYSGWEKSDDRFKTKEGFENYLQHEIEQASHPLLVGWK